MKKEEAIGDFDDSQKYWQGRSNSFLALTNIAGLIDLAFDLKLLGSMSAKTNFNGSTPVIPVHFFGNKNRFKEIRFHVSY